MDMEEIRYLLGSTIFARAKAYLDRVEDLDCETSENGVRHLTADVRGGGRNRYHTQAWLRENGSFVSASCTCPYNENGEGPCCKHIGALLMLDEEGKTQPAAVEPAQKPQLNNIPGVVRGTEFAQESAARKDSYASSLEMLFGKKWRGDEPETDAAARQLLRTYQENTLAELPLPAPEEGQRREFAELEPELTLLSGEQPWLRLRISDGGRQYLVKSIPDLLNAVEQGRVMSYGKALTFLHRKEAFAPEAQQLLAVLRRQQSVRESLEQNLQKLRGYATAARSPVAGGMALSGEGLDELVHLYEPTGQVGGYALKTGLPALTMQVEKRRGGVQVSVTPSLGFVAGLDHDYLFSDETLWKLDRVQSGRVLPALKTLCGSSLFFHDTGCSGFLQFCPAGVGPERDHRGSGAAAAESNSVGTGGAVLSGRAAGWGAVSAHAEFLYGEEKVTPFAPAPGGLLRDARAEKRAARLLGTYLQPGEDGNAAQYSTDDEEMVYTFLEEGVPALLTEGEVYLSDAFRNLQAAPPKIAVGVSVHGSVLDLEVDTGEFPVGELRALLKSLHQKKRYHRLKDGRLLRLDDSLEGLDELNETLELSGAKLGQGHTQLPLYRAPSLDWALSGQNGIRFNRDDAFRRISRSFHAVKDSEYTPPALLTKSIAKIPAGRLPLAADAGRLRHGRHPGR